MVPFWGTLINAIILCSSAVNLSIADAMVSSLNVTFNYIYMLDNDWPFGELYCKISQFIATLSISASVFTLMAISIDRWVNKAQRRSGITVKCDANKIKYCTLPLHAYIYEHARSTHFVSTLCHYKPFYVAITASLVFSNGHAVSDMLPLWSRWNRVWVSGAIWALPRSFG